MSDTLIQEATPRRNRRRVALTVTAGAAAVALGITGFLATSAYYQHEETVAGTVGVHNFGHGPIIDEITFGTLLPSDSEVQLIPFENVGGRAHDYSVVFDQAVLTGAGNDHLEDFTVDVEIFDGDANTETDEPLENATGTLYALPDLLTGELVPGEGRILKITVGLNRDADPELQGASATFNIIITADQQLTGS